MFRSEDTQSHEAVQVCTKQEAAMTFARSPVVNPLRGEQLKNVDDADGDVIEAVVNSSRLHRAATSNTSVHRYGRVWATAGRSRIHSPIAQRGWIAAIAFTRARIRAG